MQVKMNMLKKLGESPGKVDDVHLTQFVENVSYAINLLRTPGFDGGFALPVDYQNLLLQLKVIPKEVDEAFVRCHVLGKVSS